MILLNEISKMQGNNKNKLYMSKLIKIMVIPSTFPTILFQAVIISKYQIDDFMTICLNFISVLVADLITP